jgi:hypothetical protein
VLQNTRSLWLAQSIRDAAKSCRLDCNVTKVREIIQNEVGSTLRDTAKSLGILLSLVQFILKRLLKVRNQTLDFLMLFGSNRE